MKAAAAVLAAGSLVSSVLATPHDRHMAYHNRRNQDFPPFPIVERSEPESCGCTTYTTWVTVGTGGLVQPTSSKTTSLDSTVYITPSPVSTPSTPATVPTPYETSFSTTGTYTVTGTSTITLTSTHTAPTPTSTVCEGTCSYGGVTTSVTTETTVTCPYATTSVTGGVTTSIITSTTYTCPSGGEYTIIPPTTVTVTQPSTISYPTTTHYPPGTYTQPTTTVTVTKTEETFTCPYESVSPTPVPLPKPTSVSVPPQPSTTEVYVPPKPSTTEVYVPPKPSTTSVEVPPAPTSTYSPPEYTPSPSPKPKPSPSPKPQPGPVTNGNQWAMTYTPYDNAGGCKSAGSVMADIAKISSLGFTTVRTYSTDCDTLSSVGNACKANGMKMILGVFIDESGIAGAQEQVTDILGWAQWDLVEIVVVGNEAMFNGYTTAGELSGFISKVKGQLQGAGCTAPVTTTEPVDIMQEYGSQLCGAMDVFGVNIQPYFDANTSPSTAGDFVLSQLGLVKNICPGMETYNFECGWPHSGGANGAAIAGVSQQAQAIASIVEKAGSKSAIFSFTDDMWKSPGYNGVEQYFGASQCF